MTWINTDTMTREELAGALTKAVELLDKAVRKHGHEVDMGTRWANQANRLLNDVESGGSVDLAKAREPETPVIVNAAPYTGWVGYVATPEETAARHPEGLGNGAFLLRLFSSDGDVSYQVFDRRDLITLPEGS